MPKFIKVLNNIYGMEGLTNGIKSQEKIDIDRIDFGCNYHFFYYQFGSTIPGFKFSIWHGGCK